MTTHLTLTITGVSLPSWNEIMRMHHHGQHGVQQSWMLSVISVIDPDSAGFVNPVDICVTSYQAGRLIDPDNLYVKGVIDGIKSRMFPDDSPKWVDSVKLRSRKDKANPRVEIVIESVELAAPVELERKAVGG